MDDAMTIKRPNTLLENYIKKHNYKIRKKPDAKTQKTKPIS